MRKTTFLFFVLLFLSILKSNAQLNCNYNFSYTTSGTTVTFNNNPNVSLGGTLPNAISWSWDLFNNFSNSNDPVFTGATPGYHIVTLIVVDFNCLTAPTQTIFDTVYVSGLISVDENELSRSISVYPNPSAGKINVNSSATSIESIHVYNMLGALVYEDKETALKNELDLTTLQNGIYFVKVKTDAGLVTKKITINK